MWKREAGGGGGADGADPGYRIKNKNPAQSCGEKVSLALLLEGQMSKKCTSLWREVHFEVKMYKAQGFGPLWRFRCCFVWQAQGVQKCDHI